MTVTFPQDFNNGKWRAMEKLLALNDLIKGRAEDPRNSQNEGVLPAQPVPIGGRLSQFAEGWKLITNNSYILSIVAKEYRLHFMRPPLLRRTPCEI